MVRLITVLSFVFSVSSLSFASFTDDSLTPDNKKEVKEKKEIDPNLALHLAIKKGDKEGVRACIEKGAEVNRLGLCDLIRLTPLMSAIISAHPDMVELLILNGADVNLDDSSIIIPYPGFSPTSPLRRALLSNDNAPEVKRKIIKLLLLAGANFRSSQDQISALLGQSPENFLENSAEFLASRSEDFRVLVSLRQEQERARLQRETDSLQLRRADLQLQLRIQQTQPEQQIQDRVQLQTLRMLTIALFFLAAII